MLWSPPKCRRDAREREPEQSFCQRTMTRRGRSIPFCGTTTSPHRQIVSASMKNRKLRGILADSSGNSKTLAPDPLGQAGLGPRGLGQAGLGQPGLRQPELGQPGLRQPELGQPGLRQPELGQASIMSRLTLFAPSTIKSRRGATSLPISSSNTRSASRSACSSSIRIRRRVRRAGSIVVSAN